MRAFSINKLALFILLASTFAVGQYTPPPQDAYKGDTNTTCVNANTSMKIVLIGVHKAFCTQAQHGFLSRGAFLFEPAITNVDESGLSYQDYITTKYGGTAQWINPSIAQFLAFGYNSIPPYGSVTAQANRPGITKVPYIVYSNITSYSATRYNNYGTCVEKDLYYTLGYSGVTTTWGNAPTGSGVMDYQDPCWASYAAAFMAANVAFTQTATATLADKGYVIGVTTGDSDNNHCQGASTQFVAANGNYDFRCGYMAFFLAPTQYADSHFAQRYTDGTVYFKKKWKDALLAKYGTVGALNAAWANGAAYTSFTTSGNCFGSQQPASVCASSGSAVTLTASASGSAQTLGTTLSGTVSKFSIYIADNGAIVGGDTGTGLLYGPTVISSGTINYGTGALSLTFTATAGHAITIGYIQNGWGIGTGVVDEDCKVAHVAYCGDGTNHTTIYLNGIPANVVTDINLMTKSYIGDYTSVTNASVQNWATTVASPAFVGHVNYFGTTMTGTWGSPSDPYVIQGLCPNVDAYLVGHAAGQDLTQAKLDYIDTNCPGIPLINSSYRTTDQQSVMSWPNLTCTGSGSTVSCTSTTPNMWAIILGKGRTLDAVCVNSAFNATNVTFSYSAPPIVVYTAGAVSGSTTCNLFADDVGQVAGFSSQAARGADYKSNMIWQATARYTVSNFSPIIGIWAWAMHDDMGEVLNWGYQTYRGNLYNGVEDVNSVVACSSPGGAFNCGGELTVHGPPLGNYISSVQDASTAWDQALEGVGVVTQTTGKGIICKACILK